MGLKLRDAVIRGDDLPNEGEKGEDINVGGEQVEEEACANVLPPCNGVVSLFHGLEPH